MILLQTIILEVLCFDWSGYKSFINPILSGMLSLELYLCCLVVVALQNLMKCRTQLGGGSHPDGNAFSFFISIVK